MLEVEALSKKYNNAFAVKEVSFTVHKGQVLVLLGTSGCGKTTTLKMINHLVGKTTGKVIIQGRDTDTMDPYSLRRDIGYVIQETGLFPHYTIEKNIGLVPDLLGWKKPKIANRVEELLELIGLDSTIKTRMPHELSGGQRQRVGLARALAADPSLILLDEPFGALDPITRKEMQTEFIQLEGALDKAMVLVTHDVVEAVRLADQICLMDGGIVQQIGTPKQLVFQPHNDFVRKFFAGKLLELEPTVISLADLVCVLEPVSNEKGDHVEPNMRLVEALEHREGSITFTDKGKQYSIDDVLETYYKHRKAIINNINESG